MTALAGRAVTLTDTDADFPSMDAEMRADPGATAVTTPWEVTVATSASLVDQMITRSVSGAPLESRRSTVSWVVCPTTTLLSSGQTSMLATGTGMTVIEATALRPSEVAVMIAPPADTADTRPSLVTVATTSLLVDQVTLRPASTLPDASTGSAVSWSASPTNIDRLAVESRTLATGAGLTVRRAKASFPRALAAISTLPTRTPVTRPVCETVAMVSSSLDQVTRTPGNTVPSPS